MGKFFRSSFGGSSPCVSGSWGPVVPFLVQFCSLVLVLGVLSFEVYILVLFLVCSRPGSILGSVNIFKFLLRKKGLFGLNIILQT